MHALQRVILQRLSSVLPLCGLNSTEAFGGEAGGGVRVAVGGVVGVVLFVEGFDGDFAEEEEAGAVAQAGRKRKGEVR